MIRMQTKSLSIIRDNGKLSIVIPAKAGIQRQKAAEIYRKEPNHKNRLPTFA
ncbi:hypothetical protein N776_07270 [Neisseria gonorrhoeae 3502]|uniref:Uncharacterized protein n=3 Tax=Neisseria gonorrhoeae TaxID=485 RepID=A0AA44UA88_NEIGO|nr:hypothetical protein M675_03075 [Neisseria gonorrhoeae SK1902]PHJ36273.1 hypothetical protein N776_07270 [Neisseria gonorrhoeae 3502]